MLKIKKLSLKNYAGYRSTDFDFVKSDGTYKSVCCFYGPNGGGKSTALRAIELLGQAKQFAGRDNDLLFRKLTYHPDYDPTLPHFAQYVDEMRIEGVFDSDGTEKKVTVTTNGIEANDLEGFRNLTWIDADNPMNMKKFQLPSDRADVFLDIAKVVYGYEVSLGKAVETFEKGWDGSEKSYDGFATGHAKKSIVFYQDFIIEKGSDSIHFKSMSDGERKIATLLRSLCDPNLVDNRNIILIDNIEMHIYWERHARLIDKLVEIFPDKQIICTTHSGTLLQHVFRKYGAECLFDVDYMKGMKTKPSHADW